MFNFEELLTRFPHRMLWWQCFPVTCRIKPQCLPLAFRTLLILAQPQDLLQPDGFGQLD